MSARAPRADDSAGDPPSTVPLDAVEARWERSIPLPELTPAFLAEHLAPWPELAGRSWSVLSGGLRSLNLRSADLVLRIALDGRGSLQKERALLELARGFVRVPRVLGASARALLLEHVPHAPLPATAEAGRQAGRAAARIHTHAFPRAGMLDARLQVVEPCETSWSGLRGWAEQLLGAQAGARLGPERVQAIERVWAEHEAALLAECAAPVLVHADFKPTNVKWLPDEADVLVLDWEFAWAGPALFDVGQLLRWQPPEPFVAGVEQGLREGQAQLPSEWRRLAELLDLFNLVGFLDHAEDRPQRDRDVLGRIDRTLRA